MSKICIVVPCFNEQQRIDVDKFENFINTCTNVTLIFVDDGSLDETFRILEGFRLRYDNKIKVLRCAFNMGKGNAVRKGLLESLKSEKTQVVGFLDADLSTSLEEAIRIASFIDSQVHFAFGSRLRRNGASIERRAHRHILGRIFATFASIYLKLPIYDTQCGAKFFDRMTIESVFENRMNSRWIFDLEIFERYLKIYPIDSILEVPLRSWRDDGNSKLRFLDCFQIINDVWYLVTKRNS